MEEVLIVGGDLAAAKAALELAEAGVHVHLVTAGPGLESGQTGSDAWRAMPTLLAATRHPHITLHAAAQVARIEEGAASSHVILQQSPHFVDSDRCTACSVCVEVCPITLDDGRTAIRRPPPGSAPTAYTILKRGTSPCRTACPTDQRAQGYIALIAAGRYEDAYRVIQEDNPFPAICGRVCNHRCEDNCTRGQVDEPVSIRALKRFVADWMWEQVADCNLQIADCRPQTPARGERIAVVGSGPAGLTAARDLVRLGYGVTVFEALPVAGGMMRVGIPEFRLPREMLEWDIQHILDEGVELRLNCRVEDVEALFDEGYSAVLLATGLHESVRLPIPGADQPGVLGATDFMRQTNLDHPPDLTARRVVVLGGGNVAIDVARTAVRLGAAEVAMAFLEARGEMPSFAWEVEETEAEGVVLYPNRTFKAITAENGRVTGVRLVEVDFRGFVDGRPDFDELPGTEHVLPADVVVWAIGQTADLSFLPDGGPIGKTRRAIVHDPNTLMTDRPGVFVAGDVASGVTFFVVDAVSSGHRAARSIHRYLQGQPMEEEPRIQPEARPPEEELARVERRPRARSRILPVAERVDNFHEVDLGLTEEQARAEAARCLRCGICSECLECQIRCPPGAIDHTRQPRTLTLNVDAVLRVGDEGFEEALRMHRPEEPVPGDLSPSPGLTATPSPSPPGRGGGGQGVGVRSPAPPVHGGAFDRPPPNPIGVFLCRCGDEIARRIDLDAVAKRVRALPEVAWVEQVAFACHPEGSETMRVTMSADGLTRAVLAACSCCALDHFCYSCTSQRARCKEGLGVWSQGNIGLCLELVNVREQCASVHPGDQEAATVKALALVAGAVARLRLVVSPVERLTDGRPITARVDAARCRACGDCVQVCGFEAIAVNSTAAVVDAARCQGCGLCAAICPTGAVTAGYLTGAQVRATLEALLQ